MLPDDISRRPEVDHLADLVLVVDTRATLRFANAASTRVLGYDPTTKVGTSALDLVHPDDADLALEALTGTTTTGAGPKEPIVLRVAHADGSWIRLAMVANNLLDDPAVEGVVICARVDHGRDREHRARVESELRLDAVFEGAPAGMLVVAFDGSILRANPAAARLLDTPATTLVGRTLVGLDHPSDLEASLEILALVQAGSLARTAPHESELRMRRADGSYAWVRRSISVVDDEHGEPLSFDVQIIDISDRVAAEVALGAREEQYRLVVEASEQGIWRIDRDGVTTFVNGRVAEILGYPAEEMVGHHIFDFMDDGSRVEASANLRRRRDGLRDRRQARLRHALGHDVWVEVDSSPITDELGDYDGAITIITDVTDQHHVDVALRHERERFRRLVQESADIILVSTIDGAVDYASPAVETVLGYRPEELRGRSLTDLLLNPSEGAAFLSGTLAPATSMGNPVPNEVKLRHRDGSPRYCEVVARDLTEDPSVRGVVVNARDVTEARRAERRLRALFEASNDIVTILQPDGNWFASPAGTRLLGHPPGYEPEGGLLSLVHPDDIERAAVALTDVLDGRRSGSDPLEFRARTADGGYRWLEAVANDLADDPLVGGVVITARDITERRRNAAALHEAEERFAAAFEQSPIGIALIDIEGRFVEANPEFGRIADRAMSDIVGADALGFVHLDDQDRLLKIAAQAADDEMTSRPDPLRILRPDGTPVWVRVAAQTVTDEEGEVRYTIATVTDVTEQREAEDALHRSEEWYRALVQHQSDIVTVVGFDGVLRYVSPNAERILGFATDELEGSFGPDTIHPDDVDALMAGLGRQIDGDVESHPVEYRQQRADGSWIWLEATAKVLPEEFGRDAVIVNARDVTERRRAESERHEAEARFREAFASSPVGIAFANLDGQLTWVNAALAAVVGIPEARLRGMNFRHLTRADALVAQLSETRRLLRGEIENFETEMRYDHPDGRTVWGLLHVSLVRDAEGAPAQLLGQLEDVTARHEREEGLRHDAEHDALTGLLNRKGLREKLAAAWSERTPDRPLALIFGDLNGFKEVNDHHGHDAGDQVLALVSRRLERGVRAGDTLARWGGDEFVVLCPSIVDLDEAKAVAERIRDSLEQSFRIAGCPDEITVGISLGVAVDAGDEFPEALLKRADGAAYEAKRQGRVTIAVAE